MFLEEMMKNIFALVLAALLLAPVSSHAEGDGDDARVYFDQGIEFYQQQEDENADLQQ